MDDIEREVDAAIPIAVRPLPTIADADPYEPGDDLQAIADILRDSGRRRAMREELIKKHQDAGTFVDGDANDDVNVHRYVFEFNGKKNFWHMTAKKVVF